MQDYLSISKQNPQFPAYLDFQILRQIGIEHLQNLAGKLWTDYNLHDPGVTILEVLCYAVTDLGYRNNLEIEDLLALKPGATENNFFTPEQILTCNPVTILDIRKRLIDIAGVHNAWLEKVTTYDPPIWIDPASSELRSTDSANPAEPLPRLHPRGLYIVYLDLDPDYYKNACGQLSLSWSDVLDEVKAVLCRYRNLCEDIHDVVILDEEEIRLCAEIELEMDANGEEVLVNIYGQIQDFLVPQIQFHTLQELLDKNQSTAEIFAGRPARDDLGDSCYESHGFIDTAELDNLTLPKTLHTSDFYQKILNIPGIAAIKNLLIASAINGIDQSQESLWYLQLTPHYRPVLSIQNSKIRLFKNGLPIPVNLDAVKRRYYEQRSTHIKMKRDPYELDLTIPKGKYAANLASHYSIHHEFPIAYGISEEGLPEPVTVKRQAQVQQLKGYLVFFDQLLANYLAQLAHVRDVFSWEVDATYFRQPIQFPGSQAILQENYLSAITEDVERDRRDRILDHLLARFAESFTDYVLFNYKVFEHHQDKLKHEAQLAQEKARFVQDYPMLSRDRFRAFDYYNAKAVWNTDNVSGFKQRVSRLLGIDNVHRQNLNHYKVESDPGGFTVEIRCGSATLTGQQVYATAAEAEAAIEKLLSFALCSNYYKRLTYQYYYHYGFEVEVMHQGELIQARYKTYFFSRGDLDAALQPLLQILALVPDIVIRSHSSDSSDSSDLYSFQLHFGAAVQFIGVQRYFSEEIARTKANALLQQIGDTQNYRAILFHLNGENAERESPTPSRATQCTHYGYVLVDYEGTVLAESSQRFATELERNDALNQWLSALRAADCNEIRSSAPQTGNSQFTSVPVLAEQLEFILDEDSKFALQDATGNVILRSLEPYAAEKVWQTIYTFAANLLYLNRYVSSEQGIEIVDENGKPWAIAASERVPLALFKRLNPIEPFLSTQEVQVEVGAEQVLRYRARLNDRNGAILLEATQLFETEAIARDRFYQDVLGVLFEPEMCYSSTSREGFGFGVLSQPGALSRKVAVHPQFYASEQARDAVMNRLFLLIRSARLTLTLAPIEQAYIGRVYDRTGSLVLQGTQRHDSDTDCWAQGNRLMELASDEVEWSGATPDSKNFRLIDQEDGSESGIYGWELTNQAKDQILATHFYKSQSDRRTAIEALQQQVNHEGFYVLEHILLRPRQFDASEQFLPIYVSPEEVQTWEHNSFTIARRDPYSFWISIILPYWTERFRNVNFRRFVEHTLRLEAPAHVALKIAWVDVHQMEQFETAYRSWLEQLTQMASEGTACNLVGTLNNLIQILKQLRSIYPQGTLSSSQASPVPTNPIVLNQTVLGRAKKSL